MLLVLVPPHDEEEEPTPFFIFVLLVLVQILRDCTFKVGSGTSTFCVDAEGVGIGTTANGYKLNVVGDVNVSGALTANSFTGDGSGLTNLQNDSLFH